MQLSYHYFLVLYCFFTSKTTKTLDDAHHPTLRLMKYGKSWDEISTNGNYDKLANLLFLIAKYNLQN